MNDKIQQPAALETNPTISVEYEIKLIINFKLKNFWNLSVRTCYLVHAVRRRIST